MPSIYLARHRYRLHGYMYSFGNNKRETQKVSEWTEKRQLKDYMITNIDEIRKRNLRHLELSEVYPKDIMNTVYMTDN